MTDLDGLAMTNAQLETLKIIAHAMCLELDELGHPFRRVPRLDVDGERYLGVTDFDPFNDPADAFRVQCHFNLAIDVCKYNVIVRAGMGPLLAIHEIHDETAEGVVAASCYAVCKAAAIKVRREEMARQAELDAMNGD